MTGDYRIVMEGEVPSPTAVLDARAESLGNACAKYYMLAPGGILMCEDEAGQISATSHDPFIQSKTKVSLVVKLSYAVW